VITWHCGPDGLAIYRDGVLPGVIPVGKFPRLIYDLASVLSQGNRFANDNGKSKGLR